MLPLFLVAFSATVRDVSLTYRNEIRLRRMSPEEIDRFHVDPIERFQARAEYALKAVNNLPATAQGNVAIGDVRSIDLPDKSVSTIVGHRLVILIRHDFFQSDFLEAVAFYADYQVALAEMVRVTKGKIVIVIGGRVLRDTIFDNGAITIDLMGNLGVLLQHRYLRNLPTKRLPKMRKFGASKKIYWYLHHDGHKGTNQVIVDDSMGG